MGKRKPQHIWRRGRRVELVALTKMLTVEDGETRFVVGAYSPLWAEYRGLGVTEHPSSGSYAVTHLASGMCVKAGFKSISGARFFLLRLLRTLPLIDWRKSHTEIVTPDLVEAVMNAYAGIPDFYKLEVKE